MEENRNPQPAVSELQIIKAKQDAEFSLTPVGQTVKQFEVMQRMANMYTTSTIVPDTYKGNIGNYLGVKSSQTACPRYMPGALTVNSME